MFLPDNQLSNSVFIGYKPFSHLEVKIELYQINIYIFSFNVASMQGKTPLLLKVASVYLMTVPVFELPGTTFNMYFVHVDLMNRSIMPKIETFWSPEQNCLVNINAKLV